MSSSHAPTSSKPATPSTTKESTTTPAPVASQHVNAAPATTPAPVQMPTHHVVPPVVAPAPAVTHQAAQPATRQTTQPNTRQATQAPTPSATHSVPAKTVVAPSPHAPTRVATPVKSSAPVVVTPSKTGTSAAKTAFTAALVTQSGKGQPSKAKHLGDGTWRVYVTGVSSTSVTVQVLGQATEPCTDDCLKQIGTQMISLASQNISTILPVKNPTSSPAGFPGVTAPAWVYSEIFNEGQAGLNKAVADGHYTISPALKAKLDPTFANAGGTSKSVYSDITIKNGVVTDIEWTFHP